VAELFVESGVRGAGGPRLEEDLGRGDATTEATIPREKQATGVIKAKEPLVLAGLQVARRRVREGVARACASRRLAKDGDDIAKGSHVVQLAGPAWAILAAERPALNFLQRLSGVATQSRTYAQGRGGHVRPRDRHPQDDPGWRALEKYAVGVGGCGNHRADLGSGILIKDNHVAVAGGVGEAVRRARAHASTPFASRSRSRRTPSSKRRWPPAPKPCCSTT